MSSSVKLDKDEDSQVVDITSYRGIIDSLLYQTASRPDNLLRRLQDRSKEYKWDLSVSGRPAGLMVQQKADLICNFNRKGGVPSSQKLLSKSMGKAAKAQSSSSSAATEPDQNTLLTGLIETLKEKNHLQGEQMRAMF
ncbi:uncharacterized protein LOC124924571 [Impatiens glandulifera]|uniref:uncharacterized protein LOC124924571 n=1 Tax=Impatiens glandulifera TaxID=253017 RepID=UPI001FB11E1D|nr:uncharacterized protein LOC124924571 [Impatiens glandulifera]